MKNKRLASTALIYKDKLFGKELLGVSRKYDHNLFGLPGGKVDEGETLHEALIREVKEETGLDVIKSHPIFFREDGEFISTVFLVSEWKGEISTSERGLVKWITFEELKRGAFSEYNSLLENHINFIKEIN